MSAFDDLYQNAMSAAAVGEARAKKVKKVKATGPWAKDGSITLDSTLLEKLRNEFLQLMKAASKVTNYDEAIKVKTALRVWRERFDALVYEDLAKNAIWNVVAEHHFIFKDQRGIVLNYEKLNEWVKYWQPKIRSGCWGLSINLAMPIEYVETSLKTRGERYSSHEYLFSEFTRRKDKWLALTKREAVKAWKSLDEFIRWMGDRMTPIKIGVNEVANIEGFRTKLIRYGRGEHDPESMSAVPPALRIFKERARRVFPWVLKTMLPLELRFLCDLDEGGKYIMHARERYIEICVPNVVSGRDSPAQNLARIIAHEMGHHVWKTYLDEGQRKLWEAEIAADRAPIDLRKTIACWRKSGADSIWKFLDWLKENDPVSYVKIDALENSKYLRDEELSDKIKKLEDLELFVEQNNAKEIRVPRNPITVYANKNPEEAFCEAFSIAVAIGPRGLLHEVRGWLKTTLPEINLT